MKERIKGETGIIGINRKLWVALANDQLAKHRRYLGKEFAKPCATCIEILMCNGPIGKRACGVVNQMVDDGLLKGPKRMPFGQLRRKLLPVSRDCLVAYGLAKPALAARIAEIKE